MKEETLKKIYFLIVAAIIICSFSGSMPAASAAPALPKHFALFGIPLIQLKATADEAVRIELDANQKKNHRSVIIKKGDDYFWDTRDGKKVIHLVQGDLHLFVDPTGGEYVKVTKSEGGFIYMEHFSQGLETFTYWGVAERFEP